MITLYALKKDDQWLCTNSETGWTEVFDMTCLYLDLTSMKDYQLINGGDIYKFDLEYDDEDHIIHG